MTATSGWCIHGVPYGPGWSCPQCSSGTVCHQCGWPSGTHAESCTGIQVVFGKWAALASAEAEADRLRTKLDATEARLVEAEATIARLREAVNNHGQCSCRYTPGFPRGSRHASDCDYDPYLLAALTPEADR